MANRFRRLLSFGLDSGNRNEVNSNEQRTGPMYRAPSPDNFACNLSSLHNINPSNFIMPNNCPKVNKLKGISFVAKFCTSLLRMRSPNNLGSPAIKRSFQHCRCPSFLLSTFV